MFFVHNVSDTLAVNWTWYIYTLSETWYIYKCLWRQSDVYLKQVTFRTKIKAFNTLSSEVRLCYNYICISRVWRIHLLAWFFFSEVGNCPQVRRVCQTPLNNVTFWYDDFNFIRLFFCKMVFVLEWIAVFNDMPWESYTSCMLKYIGFHSE